MAFLIALHVLAAAIWVGGMFFAYMVLRPSAGPLQPDLRFALWQRVFSRFFPVVWACVVVLLITGYGMVFHAFGGFGGVGLYVNLMQGIGIVMMLLFAHLFFAPWRRLKMAVRDKHIPEAGKQLAQIRRIVALNLALGVVTIAVGAGGRFW